MGNYIFPSHHREGFRESSREGSREGFSRRTKSKKSKSPPPETVDDGHYKIVNKIASGAFGTVYRAESYKTGGDCCIKMEYRYGCYTPTLWLERNVYHDLWQNTDNLVGFSKFYGFFNEGDYNVLVLDLLGSSIAHMFEKYGYRFGLETVLLLSVQMIERVKQLHDVGYIHRDIKPDNFMVGLGESGSKMIYLVDFGLAKQYLKQFPDGDHIKMVSGKSFIGTFRYASLNAHLGLEQGRRDDLISLGYILVYFLKDLPWRGFEEADKKKRCDMVKRKKLSVSHEELCEGLPEEFLEYFKYCFGLEYDEKPNYEYLQNLFRELYKAKDFKRDLFEFETELLKKKDK